MLNISDTEPRLLSATSPAGAEVPVRHQLAVHLRAFPRIAQVIAERGEFSFSVAFGLNGSATEAHRPYVSDEAAKQDRDDLAKVLRRAGYKVRLGTLKRQRREWWGWATPCGITCNVYSIEIVEHPEGEVLLAA